MKSKLCWVTFIPVTLLAVALKVIEKLNVFPAVSGDVLSYSALGAIILMFLINIIFVVTDHKTSPAYLLTRNIYSAVFSLAAAAMITSKSALTVILDIQNGKFDALSLLLTILGIGSAICLVVISLAHIQGRNFLPRLGVVLLAMPIWAGLMLVTEFLENRKVSVYEVDEFKLFALVFAMIFLFKVSMIISTIDGRNPVKSMYLYGLPLASIGIVIGVVDAVDIALNGIDYSENVFAFALLSLGLYALFLIIEITKLSRTKAEQVIKFDLDDFDEEQRVYGAHQDNFVVAPEEQTGDYDYDYSSSTVEAESFVTAPDDQYTSDYDYEYGYGTEADQSDLVVAPDEDEEDNDVIYVDSDVIGDFEERILGQRTQTYDSPVNNKEAEYDEEQMEKINRLIEDINS